MNWAAGEMAESLDVPSIGESVAIDAEILSALPPADGTEIVEAAPAPRWQQYRCDFDMASDGVQVLFAEWDTEGVYVYQAFCDEIADWAVANQHFGGPKFDTIRMTWIKPSFAWVLYRSGYGHKPRQNRILKVKLPHEALAHLLSQCKCVDTNKETRSGQGTENGAGAGRVQWDPERDLMSANGREPRMLLRRRAIQIGLKGRLSEFYVKNVASIEDVTELGHRICQAHRAKKKSAMLALLPELPDERPYKPGCPDSVLAGLGMLPGDTASALSRLGRGRASG